MYRKAEDTASNPVDAGVDLCAALAWIETWVPHDLTKDRIPSTLHGGSKRRPTLNGSRKRVPAAFHLPVLRSQSEARAAPVALGFSTRAEPDRELQSMVREERRLVSARTDPEKAGARWRRLASLRHDAAIRILAVDLSGDVIVALVKFFAAAVTASSAMFSEGVHSVMDMATEITLLYGIIASRRPATIEHQFGFGREAYFWNFIASLLILAAGAGITLHDGIEQIISPVPLHHEETDFAVLFAALVIETGTLIYAVRNGGFPTRGDIGWGALLARSRDTSSLTVLFTSAASIVGLFLAALGIGFGRALHEPRLDGLASVAITLVLASIAFAIAARSEAMLIGASATPEKVARLSNIAGRHAAVTCINGDRPFERRSVDGGS